MGIIVFLCFDASHTEVVEGDALLLVFAHPPPTSMQHAMIRKLWLKCIGTKNGSPCVVFLTIHFIRNGVDFGMTRVAVIRSMNGSTLNERHQPT
jgi:hypothetical protein